MIGKKIEMILKLIKDLIKKLHIMPLSAYCKICGRVDIPLFDISDKLWKKVVGKKYNILCIYCFDRMARKKGISILYGDKDFGERGILKRSK